MRNDIEEALSLPSLITLKWMCLDEEEVEDLTFRNAEVDQQLQGGYELLYSDPNGEFDLMGERVSICDTDSSFKLVSSLLAWANGEV